MPKSLAVQAARAAEREKLVSDEMLTVAQAADYAKLSKAFIYNLAARGDLRSVRAGSRVLIPRRALIRYLADRERVT